MVELNSSESSEKPALNETAEGRSASTSFAVFALVLLFFFFSGSAGLIYEVIWTRLLLALFGATLYAVATVLAAFMGGLALGSLIGGWLADRIRKPLFLYGVLEILIAGTAISVPSILKLFDPIYQDVYASGDASFLKLSLIRFTLSFLTLLIPTTCMGATLPLLSRFLVRRSDGLGGRIGGLYAINTTGAVLGTFLAGFYFISEYGVSGTIHLAAAISALVGVASILLSLKLEASVAKGWQNNLEAREASPAARTGREAAGFDITPGLARLVLFTYGLSGFVALAYQVFWTRALVFRFENLKNTTYAFSAMLTVFLIGLAAGSAVMSARIDRERSPLRLYGLLQILIGLSGAFSLIMLVRFVGLLPLSPAVNSATGDIDMTRAVLNVFIRTALTIGLPTFLMGMTFPVVARLCIRHLNSVGSGIGRLYAVNTFGAILGSFAAGFVMIPLFGLAKGFLVLGLLNVLIGTVILSLNPVKVRDQKISWSIGWSVVILAVFGLFYWRVSQHGHFQDLTVGHEMIAYEEGPLATVAVVENNIGERTIYVDNVGVAGTDRILLTDQKSLAHVPMLFLKNPKSALTVGFGSGGASWSFLQYKELERVDCIEICRTVPKMAKHLKVSNHGVLDEWDGESSLEGQTFHDGRYRVIVDDARSYLHFTETKYDVIATDCTDLRYKSNANLYDVEYFELCKKRITDEGMVVVWMPLAGMSKKVFGCAMETFAEVFPNMTVWYMNNEPTHYLLLLGTKEPFRINLSRMLERLNRPEIRDDLAEVSLQQAGKILSCFLGEAGDFHEAFANDFDPETDGLNTEDNPFLEFESPKFGYGEEPMFVNLETLRSHSRSILSYPYIEDREDHPELVERLGRFEKIIEYVLIGHVFYRDNQIVDACKQYQLAAKICPEDLSVQFLLTFDALRRRVSAPDSTDYWAELMLAEVELLQSEIQSASQHYDKALQFATPLRSRIMSDFSTPNLSEAQRAEILARAEFPLFVERKSVLGLARCYQALKRYKKALDFLDLHKGLFKKDADYVSLRGTLVEEVKKEIKE